MDDRDRHSRPKDVTRDDPGKRHASNGRAYKVVWPDAGGFNPGYQIAKEPTSYPGINAAYRRTVLLIL